MAETTQSRLILKRAKVSRPSGHWGDDDYDVICEGAVVGRVLLSPAAPQDRQWMWTLAYGYHEDRTPTHGYELTREAAMEASASPSATDGFDPRRVQMVRMTRCKTYDALQGKPAPRR